MNETVSLDGEAGAEEGEPSVPGGAIGRFLILGLLGRGGMGVVLSAYDPLLDRRVALKLLGAGALGASDGGSDLGRRQARLLGEAQAMARLSHPNVVAVHEAGIVDGRCYIAMEQVEGETLAAHLSSAAGRRPWREIVRLLVAAGQGLAAAHRSGLVHGDFKPENVLVGSDGRARVGDFGLASAVGGGRGGAPAGPPGEATARPAGTPGYLAPERLRGEPGDAQSDQFSFCVALYQALYGQRPFVEAPREAHERAVLAGEVLPPPRRSDVPRWIGEVALRGLRPQKHERWPSMEALLAELGRDRDRRRRSIVLGVGVVVAVAALGAAAATVRERRAAACGGAAARLQGVWDDELRQAARGAFTATGVPFAADTFTRVAASLDGYAAAWAVMYEEACRATRVEGRQSDALLDLRMECLDRRRATLAALTGEWSRGVQAEALENAIAAAAALPPIAECADVRLLSERAPPPRDPAQVARVAAVRAHLDRARALGDARRLKEARAEAELARAEADATGFTPVRAEAALLVGSLIHLFLEPGADAPLDDAIHLAEIVHDDPLAAAAAIELTASMADGGRAPAALQLAPIAEALVARAGDRPAQRGALLVARGSALSAVGRYREALVALDEAQRTLSAALGERDPLTLRAAMKRLAAIEHLSDAPSRDRLAHELLARVTDVFGAEHPQTGVVLGRLAIFAVQAADYAGAREKIDRVQAIADHAFGADSLPAALATNMRGVLAEEMGRLEEARAHYERVLAIRQRLLPAGNPLVAHALANLSIVQRLQGHLDEALEATQAALGIMRAHYGGQHPDVAYESLLLADIYADKGDAPRAEESYQRAISVYEQVDGPESLSLSFVRSHYADFLERQGRCDQARRLALEALGSLEKAPGANDPTVGSALLVLGRCDLRDGDLQHARERLERGAAVLEGRGAAPALQGSAHFDLARVLVRSGLRDRTAALADRAERELTQAGPPAAAELTRLRAWRRSDGRSPRR